MNQRQENLSQFRVIWKNRIAPFLKAAPGGCLIWPFLKTEKGYGIIHFAGRNHRVHRVALAVELNQPLGKLQACHSCDNPSCANPAHLFAGTHPDNWIDATSKGRQTAGVAGVQKWRGEKHGRAKLTEMDVQQIRLRCQSAPPVEVAREFSINRSTVSKISKRLRWAHIA